MTQEFGKGVFCSQFAEYEKDIFDIFKLRDTYSESELEQEIINKLKYFLLELGHGFAFVARKQRITFDDKHFRIDLVFYNRILKCFILINLKIGALKHQDLGPMQM